MRIKPFFGSYIDHRSENNQLQHSDNLYDCFYKVLNLSQDNLQRLEQVRLLQEELGRIPTKKDVSRELRLPLQEACGTWTNVLFQLGISPGEYHAAQRKAREKREGAGKKKKI